MAKVTTKGTKSRDKKGVRRGEKRSSSDAFEELNILGLTEVEEKIVVGLLELGPTSVNRLSRQIFVPHTTIHYAIRKLKERRLVRRVSKGYRSVWEVVKPEKIQKELKEALLTLTPYPTVGEIEDKIGVKVSEKSDFFTIEGVEDMLKTYQWLLLNHRNQRLCGIQTLKSSESAYTKLSAEALQALNALVLQNKVILDIALPESIKSLYTSILARKKGFWGGSGAENSLVPDKFLDFAVDIFIATDIAVIGNWEKETLVLVRNKEFVDLLSHLFSVVKEFSSPFDQNSFISQFK